MTITNTNDDDDDDDNPTVLPSGKIGVGKIDEGKNGAIHDMMITMITMMTMIKMMVMLTCLSMRGWQSCSKLGDV